jgi:hypothetical protein
MRALSLSFILFGCIFYSCGDSEPEMEKQSSLFPLNIGNIWTYEQTTYNGGIPETKITTTEIKYAYTIDGQYGFSPDEYIKGQPFSLFSNDNEGNTIEYFFDKEALVYKTIQFKKNAKANDKWIYKSAVFTNDDYLNYDIEEREKLCTTADTLIITPKGSFHCIGFVYHPGGYDDEGQPYHTMIQYFSENIGLVKNLHYEHIRGRTVLFSETALINYLVKQ